MQTVTCDSVSDPVLHCLVLESYIHSAIIYLIRRHVDDDWRLRLRSGIFAATAATGAGLCFLNSRRVGDDAPKGEEEDKDGIQHQQDCQSHENRVVGAVSSVIIPAIPAEVVFVIGKISP